MESNSLTTILQCNILLMFVVSERSQLVLHPRQLHHGMRARDGRAPGLAYANVGSTVAASVADRQYIDVWVYSLSEKRLANSIAADRIRRQGRCVFIKAVPASSAIGLVASRNVDTAASENLARSRCVNILHSSSDK